MTYLAILDIHTSEADWSEALEAEHCGGHDRGSSRRQPLVSGARRRKAEGGLDGLADC